MGSVKVTVYGRIKPCSKSPQDYRIKCGDDEDQITFINSKSTTRRSFRFKKIFGEDATQEEIFETVAKPVIKNVFSGYNGTVFTYGQTGSGKTYTMTGDVEEWVSPGLIPRIIQEIFKAKRLDAVVTITFCEIYNEHIYDLIRTDRTDSELQPVSVLEVNSGITHFRNLSAYTVKSADEAMQLFLRGDANKMIAETGSNVRSSRSHVIFSVGLEFPHPTQENVRLKPVLYLVDLAGSEKLSKCKTPVSNVSETRYINLSLHYLEQVLVALRQPGRAHIPYRNSLMTALLRNSLGGNCITIMIATFSVCKEDAEETAQTCRFAERIALIKNEVKLSELVSPEKEIDFLRKENERLKAQLKLISNEQVVDQLDEKDKEKCFEVVRNFIQDNEYFELPLTNVRRMEYCFRIMREELLKEREFIECKDTKSKESHLELLKSFQTSDMQQKLSQHHMAVLPNKVLLKKKNSLEIPKVNIIYEKWKTEEQSAGREYDASKINSKKVSFSDKVNEDFKELKINNSKQLRKTCTENMPKNSFLSPYFIKEKNIENKAIHENSRFTQESLCEENKKKKHSISVSTPKLSITNSTCSATALTFDLLAQDFSSKNLEVFDCGRAQTEEKINSKTELKYLEEKVSQTPTLMSNDFKAFTAKCVPLTGDKEVDEEILKFYESRYRIFQNK